VLELLLPQAEYLKNTRRGSTTPLSS